MPSPALERLVVVHANRNPVRGDASEAVRSALTASASRFGGERTFDLVHAETYLGTGMRVDATDAILNRSDASRILEGASAIYLAGGKFAYPANAPTGCHYVVFEQLLRHHLNRDSRSRAPAQPLELIFPAELIYLRDPGNVGKRIETIPLNAAPLFTQGNLRDALGKYWRLCATVASWYGHSVGINAAGSAAYIRRGKQELVKVSVRENLGR